MNNNDFNSQENNDQKEEIKFDDKDFRNPYADYYARDYRQNNEGYGNPYSSQGGSTADDFSAEFKVKEESAYAPLLDEDREKRNFSRIGRGYLLFSVISTAVSIIIQLIVLLINRDFYNSTLFLNLVTPLSLYVFALPVLLIILSKSEATPPQKRKMSFGAFLIFLITAFGFMYIGALVGNSVMDFLSEAIGYDYSNGLNSLIDQDSIWITAIFTVVVAPIGEEFVFRKLIIDRTQKYGGFISIGLSGLMFGLMHGNFYQFFYCFALGLLLGYIYYSTGKLYITIAIHAIVNFFGSVVSSFLSPISEELINLDPNDIEAMMTLVEENLLPIIGLLLFSLFTYVAMACAVIFPIAFRKKLKLNKGEITIPKKRIIPIVILNSGIIAMMIFYIFEFGLNLLPL